MLQTAALAFRASTEQKCTHARGKSNTDGVHIRLDVLHGVKNSKPVVNRTAGGIHI